jgi:hypothetical protein
VLALIMQAAELHERQGTPVRLVYSDALKDAAHAEANQFTRCQAILLRKAHIAANSMAANTTNYGKSQICLGTRGHQVSTCSFRAMGERAAYVSTLSPLARTSSTNFTLNPPCGLLKL